jgi:hypothetical protein
MWSDTSTPQDARVTAKQRVGDQTDPVHVEHDCRVAEPRHVDDHTSSLRIAVERR